MQVFACCRRARTSSERGRQGCLRARATDDREPERESEGHKKALKAMRAKFSQAWRELARIKRELKSGQVPAGNSWERMSRHQLLKKRFEFYSRTLKHVKDVKKDCAGLVF